MEKDRGVFSEVWWRNITFTRSPGGLVQFISDHEQKSCSALTTGELGVEGEQGVEGEGVEQGVRK